MRPSFVVSSSMSILLFSLPVFSQAREVEEGPATLPSSAPEPPIYDPSPSVPASLPPPLPAARRRTAWGLAARIETAPMGEGAAEGAGMGGLGFSLRPRFNRYFALDLGFDAVGGHDFNGEKRSEGSFTVNPMFFVNPAGRATLYLLAGLGFAGAKVTHADLSQDRYRYVGLDAGIGLEVRLWGRTALDFDVLAFARKRTDDRADLHPEFVDRVSGRTTNESAGALVRLGFVGYL